MVRECFDIDDTTATKLAVVSGQELENNEMDFISRSSALGCVLGVYDRHRLKQVPDIMIYLWILAVKIMYKMSYKLASTCGSKVEIVGVGNTNPFQVWCEECGLQFGGHKDYLTYQLIEVWNKKIKEQVNKSCT